LASAARLWTTATGNVVFSSPTVADGMVFAGSEDDNIYAYALNAGNAEAYKHKQMAPPSPASLHPDYGLQPAY
jgi:outer membrane protein assembly factor BamB